MTTNQSPSEILEKILQTMYENSIRLVPKTQLEVQGGDEFSLTRKIAFNDETCGNDMTQLISNHENQVISKIVEFDPKSLTGGDILMVAIIVAAVQSNLIPTFEIELESIQHMEKFSATSSASLNSSASSKKVFPSLTFIDSRNFLCITFSMVSVFGEFVIYATKKSLNSEKEKKVQALTIVQQSAVQVVGDKKKKRIQTLFLDPNDFIFANTPNENINRNISKNISIDIETNNKDISTVHNYNTFNSNCDDINNSRTHQNKKSKRNNGMKSCTVGTYVVKLYELTLRMSSTLIDPLLFEE